MISRVLALALVVAGSAALPVGSANAAVMETGSPWLSPAPVSTQAYSSSGIAFVGALFSGSTSNPSNHFCTAGVINSPKGNLLLTAGHCIGGSASGLTFVPDYMDGEAPYGAWTVTGAYSAPAWLQGQNPEDDFTFLTVAPQTIGGQSVSIQSLTGAAGLAAAPQAGQVVTVTAYNDGATGPVACSAAVTYERNYPDFVCNGYVGGSSGSPWLVTGDGGYEVVGIIGGLLQGGCTPAQSFSPIFGTDISSTYSSAVSAAPPTSLPSPPPSGC